MAMELWTHDFCLYCDTQTDGSAYCSQACRLADFDNSSPCSSPSSPDAYLPWEQQPSNYDFSSPQAFFNNVAVGNTSYSNQPRYSSSSIQRTLTPSSSTASLSSLGSLVSRAPSTQESMGYNLTDKSRQELQAYALLLEQVRQQRPDSK